MCHRNHLKLRYDKSQFLVHKVEYLGFERGYGWWKPSSSKVAPILEGTIKDVKEKKGKKRALTTMVTAIYDNYNNVSQKAEDGF